MYLTAKRKSKAYDMLPYDFRELGVSSKLSPSREAVTEAPDVSSSSFSFS